MAANHLFFGDNLGVLRSGEIAWESVDLIYLDPPFNSNASYNMLFREPEGTQSQAQISAFEDTWQWSLEAEQAFDDVLTGSNQRLGKLLNALREALGDNSMMAYLAMMAVRLVELHKVLKPTGSLYLHCDPSASHYLKLLLDAVFGPENFRNEIIWKRQSAHNDAIKKFASVSDTILFYAKSAVTKFHVIRRALDSSYQEKFYRHVDADGRRYRLSDMSAPEGGGMAAINKATGRPNGWHIWNGYQPPARGWRYSPETLNRLHAEGRVYCPEDKTKRPALKRFLDENKGQAVGNIWDDINSLNAAGREGLGYPTQKPLALLERIITASSNEGDVVLDPFCGCGTTIHAAQRLKRQWIGIDVTHLAISLIENRLEAAFPGISYELHGTPTDLAGAHALAAHDKHQFEWWALSLVKAQPAQDKKKGSDKGIDGLLWVRVGTKERAKVVVSVKGGANISVQMVRDLWGVIEREQAAIGMVVCLAEPTKPMLAEAYKAGFYEWEGQRFPRIQILTIEQLLNGKRPELPLIDFAAMTKQAPVDAVKINQGQLI